MRQSEVIGLLGLVDGVSLYSGSPLRRRQSPVLGWRAHSAVEGGWAEAPRSEISSLCSTSDGVCPGSMLGISKARKWYSQDSLCSWVGERQVLRSSGACEVLLHKRFIKTLVLPTKRQTWNQGIWVPLQHPQLTKLTPQSIIYNSSDTTCLTERL